MRRPLVALAVMIAVVLVLADRATAQRRPPQAEGRHGPGDRRAHHAPGRHGPAHDMLRHGHGNVHPRPRVYSPDRFGPRWGGAYRYEPRWTYDFDYSYGRYPYSYPYPPGGYPYYWPYYYRYPPPVFLPAETIYGPEAMKRFMGVDHWFRPQAGGKVVVVPDQQPKQPAAAGQGEHRATNQQALNLAWKFVGYGDAHFGNQKYSEANARYRKAAAAAPQLADGWFRQGFALVAMGRYDLAVQAIKRGLKFKPNWADSDFRLNELYGGNALTKSAHLDALAEAAKENPNDTDLLFLLGVLFHFDGKPDRAAPLLQRAKQLLGGDDAHLRGFLP